MRLVQSPKYLSTDKNELIYLDLFLRDTPPSPNMSPLGKGDID
jgi:hypothetical protein